MKSSDILRAFSDADERDVEQAADTRGKTYQPDISVVLEAIRTDAETIPAVQHTEHENNISRVWLWACGLAACAVIGFTGVMLASRTGNVIEPGNSAENSVPVEVVTGTGSTETTVVITTPPAVLTTKTTAVETIFTTYIPPDDIQFTVVEADREHFTGEQSMEELRELSSCIIHSPEELKQNIIQPVKKYSEEFFKDHALIFVTKVFARISETKVSEIQQSYDSIEIYAEREFPTEEQKDNWWCVFLEVDSSLVADRPFVELWVDDPKEIKPPSPDSVRKVTPDDARKPDLANITGQWSGYPYYWEIAADGSFSYYYHDEERAKGKVTAEGKQYVFRYENGDTETAVPEAEDPLNTLQLTQGGNMRLLMRYEGMQIYDRQCRPVTEAAFTGTPVKELEGEWFIGEENTCRIFDGGTLTGAFERDYKEYTSPNGYMGEYYTITGTIRVEEGIDNSGNKAYYYCFYNEKNERIMTMSPDMTAMAEGQTWIDSMLCEDGLYGVTYYYHLYPEMTEDEDIEE